MIFYLPILLALTIIIYKLNKKYYIFYIIPYFGFIIYFLIPMFMPSTISQSYYTYEQTKVYELIAQDDNQYAVPFNGEFCVFYCADNGFEASYRVKEADRIINSGEYTPALVVFEPVPKNKIIDWIFFPRILFDIQTENRLYLP